ncbi:MAG: HAD family hydrolase [Novosphingobium sp.]
MKQPIEAVVFDVGNVLVRWERHLPYVKHFPDPAELAWFMDTVIPLEWHARHDAGESAESLVAERASLFPEHAGLIAAWFANFNESIPGPIPGSPELVEALAARGVPLYGITNFGADTWAGFRPTFPLFERFRDIVVSGIEKVSKPGREIFDLAAQRFGHAPGAMLFVDDHPANIAAALDYGWQVHHFKDAAGLEAELKTQGLLA